MKSSKIVVVVSVVVLAALAGAGYAYFSSGRVSTDKGAFVSRKTVSNKKAARAARPKTQLSMTSKKFRGEDKPDLSFDDEFESSLTPELKKLMADLQQALDDENLAAVSKIAERVQAMQAKGGSDAVPAEVREKLIDALGWFLPDTLADLIGFLADSDPEIHQDVISQFESALDDTSLGDRELSVIVKQMCKVLTDEDAIEALFFCVETDMRNSIAVDTYKYIMKNGTEQVKERVVTSMEDFTGEDNIATEADLDKWAADPENADDEDDEDFYAGEADEVED